MRRGLAVLLLLVFAFLAGAEAVRCPDGCRARTTADGRTSSGSCTFCTGGVLALAAVRVVTPPGVVLRAPAEARLRPAARPASVPERPPRLA